LVPPAADDLVGHPQRPPSQPFPVGLAMQLSETAAAAAATTCAGAQLPSPAAGTAAPPAAAAPVFAHGDAAAEPGAHWQRRTFLFSVCLGVIVCMCASDFVQEYVYVMYTCVGFD
jgi:hypothetical protein